jgi:hypothetical protein
MHPDCAGPAAAAAAAPAALPATSAVIHRTFHNAATGVLGCQHYQRQCQLVAPCCNKIFTCRYGGTLVCMRASMTLPGKGS